jgi:hypothetical protein
MDAQHTETKLFSLFLFEINPRQSVQSVGDKKTNVIVIVVVNH